MISHMRAGTFQGGVRPLVEISAIKTNSMNLCVPHCKTADRFGELVHFVVLVPADHLVPATGRVQPDNDNQSLVCG